MAKKGKSIPKQHVTKRRLARWQQERRRRRIYTAAGILVIAIIAVIIFYGFYTTSISMAGEWVTTVGGTRYVGTDYADALHLCQLGFSPSSSDLQEAPILFIEQNELVRQGTAELGITANESEVTDEIRKLPETDNESLTDEEFEEWYQQNLEAMELTDEEFRRVMENALLQGKLYEYLLEDMPQTDENVTQIYVEIVVVSNESEVADVQEKIGGGANLSDLQWNYSYTDIGWVPRGVLAVDMEEVAFALEVGEISDPMYTSEIYYYIQVSGKEERPLDEAMREQLEYSALTRWVTEESEEKVERNPNLDLDKMYNWAVDRIGGVSGTPLLQE